MAGAGGAFSAGGGSSTEDGGPLVGPSWELATAALTRTLMAASACTAVHLVGRGLMFAVLPKRWLARVPKKDVIYVPEMVVSTIHGVAVGLGGLKLMLDGHFGTDVITPYPPLLDSMFAFSAGYSLHDMVVMALHGEPASMWAHHLITAAGTFLMMVYRQVAFFPALFQMTELTVLPTNVLWFATKFQVQAPRLKRAAILLRALFYVVFRLFVGPLALAHAVRCHGGAGFLSKFLAAPWPVWVGNTFNVGSLSYLNVVWTLAAVRRALGKARRA